MNVLGRPGVVAVLTTLLAAAVHPLARQAGLQPETGAVLPALALLTGACLALRARWLTGVGAAVLLGALGYDAVRGHEGTLSLVPGQGTQTFEERGVGGRRLGLCPLGFVLKLEAASADGNATLVSEAGRMQVTSSRSAAHRGFRFGQPRVVATEELALLRIAVSGAGPSQTLGIVPGRVTRLGDLGLALESYDPRPRDPVAVLLVMRGGTTWRLVLTRDGGPVPVAPELGVAFAMAGAEPVRSVTFEVTQQPAAELVAIGLLLLAAGLAGRTRLVQR